MIGARIQIAPLFYSFHHPKYQQLHLRDLCQRVQMPDELKSYQMKNEVFSVSGVSSCGQGADVIHEEINKLVKSFLPPGMPTTETWERVCRKATDLREMKVSATNSSGIVEKKSHKKIENVVTMMRRKFRNRLFKSPQCYSPLTSISNQILDNQLANLKYAARENYENYKEHYTKTKMFGCKILNPVFITKYELEESQRIENKTKKEIINEINLLLAEMPIKETAMEMQTNQKGKTSKTPRTHRTLLFST